MSRRRTARVLRVALALAVNSSLFAPQPRGPGNSTPTGRLSIPGCGAMRLRTACERANASSASTSPAPANRACSLGSTAAHSCWGLAVLAELVNEALDLSWAGPESSLAASWHDLVVTTIPPTILLLAILWIRRKRASGYGVVFSLPAGSLRPRPLRAFPRTRRPI